MTLCWPARAENPPPDLSGTPISDEALFVRCYRAITRLEPSADHPKLIQVQQGADPISACLEVFDQATLFASATEAYSGAYRLEPVVFSTPLQNDEARAILRTFEDHFKSWFTFKDWSNVPELYVGLQGLRDRLDSSEDALQLVRALFQGPGASAEGHPFSQVVLGVQSVSGIRQWVYRPGVNGGCYNYLCPEWLAQPEWGTRDQVPTAPGQGQLFGLRVFPELDSAFFSKNGTRLETLTDLNGQASAIKLPRAFNGGILGNGSFLAKYAQYDTRANGGRFARRRWMGEVLKSLLCRSLPSLRHEDVSGRVLEFNSLSADVNAKALLPFRAETNCARCHASIDEGAAVARGFYFNSFPGWGSNFLTVGDFNSDNVTSAHPQNANPDRVIATELRAATLAANGIALHLQLEDSNFNLRPSSGRLHYRSYSGELVNVALEPSTSLPGNRTPWTGDDGIGALGKAISEGNDLYVCAASRMIRHFTGVSVNLSDPGDPSTPPLTTNDALFRTWAEQLALNPSTGLKTTQRLRSMLERLLRSDLYRTHGHRSQGAP